MARALGTLPLLAQALARGELSYAKVRALTRVATPETEARLLGSGTRRHGLPRRADRARLALRGPQGRGPGDRSDSTRAGRCTSTRTTTAPWCSGGGWSQRSGALLIRALAAARETLYQRTRGEGAVPRFADPTADRPTMAQQQADALALLAEAALRHELDPGAPGERYQVVVHVDAAVLADPDQPGQSVLEDGPRVSAETSRRLACDSSRVVMRHDEDGPHRGGRGPDPNDSPGIAARAPPPGPGLPLPGLRTPLRPGTSRPPLGAGRPDHALESRHALSPAPPRGPRRGLSGRSTARRRAPVPAARWPAATRRPAPGRGARRSGPGPPRAARRAGAPAPRADDLPVLAGRAPGSRLCDRRPASAWPTRLPERHAASEDRS